MPFVYWQRCVLWTLASWCNVCHQESKLEANRKSLKKVEATIAKQMREKVEVEEEMRQAEEAVVSLEKQLNEVSEKSRE